MSRIRGMLHRMRGWFRRRALETEMKLELESHLDALTERNLAAGLSPVDARFAAMREFGGLPQITERARDQRRSVWLEQVAQDLRYAVRSLRKTPAFTITAVVTLAFGIGVNAALFSLFNLVALRSLPVKDPDAIVFIRGQEAPGSSGQGFNYAEYLAYRDGNRTLEELAAIRVASLDFQARAGEEPEAIPVQMVSENYFELLGGTMSLGRGFLPEELSAPGAAAVVVLNHSFWVRRCRSDPQIIGAKLRFGRQLFTVIGVTSAEFPGHDAAPIAGWMPLTMSSNRAEDYSASGPAAFDLLGRLKPGVSETQAKADLDAIALRWATQFPGEHTKTSVRLQRGLHFAHIPITPVNLARLSPLFLGFGMVLVIACTNVANLLVARGISRQSEIGVRLTLGASRGRIVRQLLTENLLLCVLGAVTGLALATWTLQIFQPIFLAPLFPPSWLLFMRPIPDLRVLGFTGILTLGAALVAGLVPAIHTANSSVWAAVSNNGSAFGRRLTPSRLRQLLVIGQVAVCLTLLSSAGVLARNFLAPKHSDQGFDTSTVFSVRLEPNPAIADRAVAFRQALNTIRAIPGVAGIGVANPPLFEVLNATPTQIRTAEAAPRGSKQETPSSFVTGGFFEAFNIPILRGRTFRELEEQSASRAVLVSESLARRLWPGREAVGQTLAVSESPWGTQERPSPVGAFRECEVIGVARDVMLQINETDHLVVYLPFPLETTMYPGIYVRPHLVTAGAQAEIVRAAKSAGVGLKFDRPLSMGFKQREGVVYGLAMLSGALGLLALAMASVGLYGLMVFKVSQQVREIGIRIALGADSNRVVGLFVRQGMRLVSIGLALGLVGGGLFALLLRNVLFGMIDSFDLTAFMVVTVLFAVIAFFACWFPARRATKVDPMVALRAE